MCRVANKYKEDYGVYIGRGSVWGNPYVIGEDGNREEVIKKYEWYLKQQIVRGNISKNDLRKLNGKVLGCFCKPKACHGDIIAKAVKWSLKNG